MDIVDRNSEHVVNVDAEQQLEQVASTPLVKIHLKRSTRVRHPSTWNSTYEYMLLTDGRELDYFAEIIKDEYIQIRLVTLIPVSPPI